MTDILTFDQLKEITGYIRPSDVERCLKSQGITVFFGKDGPWTTMWHLNHPYGSEHTPKSHDAIYF